MSPEEARLKGSAVVSSLVQPLVEITAPMTPECRLSFWLGLLHSIRGCVTADVNPGQAEQIFKDLAAGATRAKKKRKLN